jgi:hypothetical protein
MKSYDDLVKELREETLYRQQKLRDIESLHRFAESVERIVEEKWNTGLINIRYWLGNSYLFVTFSAHDGLHPIKEGLIVLDELFYNGGNDDLILEIEPTSLPTDDGTSIQWKFRSKTFPKMCLYFEVVIREAGECRQVPTGEYKPVMKWVCS